MSKAVARRRGYSSAIPLLLMALTGVAPAAPAPVGPSPSPDLLLVTVDTLRPDAVGWVSGSKGTPALDRLAAQSFRFPAAISPAPLTLPAHASLMTGLLPPRHGVRDNGQVLGAGPALLADLLRRQGYATAAFVSGYPLTAPFGLARGFEHFDDRLTAGEGAWLERPAAETTAAALAWLAAARSPWFVWVHYYDPHYPYEPPPGFRGGGRRGDYDGEVAFVDRAIADLLARLGPQDGAGRLTVFAADHGESLGEHGEGTHGFFIYDSTVLVPMLFHQPGRIRPGESRGPARLVDVTPTVLELLGLPPLAGTDGRSLVAVLTGREDEFPPAYLETYQPWTSYGWSPLKAVRSGDWKLIVAPRPELYHLTEDPAEEQNLFGERREQARQLKVHLNEIEARPPVASAAIDDPGSLARLRALGYLGGGRSPDEPPAGLPDPKDRSEVRDLLTVADRLLRQGAFTEALERFDSVLAQEPENRFAVSRSAEALLRAGKLEEALPRLRKAVALDPDQPEVRALLAEALTSRRDCAGAIPQWMELIRLQPGRAAAWSQLGNCLGMTGRTAEAVDALSRAAELAPGEPDRLIRLAFAEFAAGRTEAAVGHLLQAEEITGSAEFPHAGALGILLHRLGRAEQARERLARSRPTEAEYAEARLQLALLEAGAGNPVAARQALREALAADPRLRPRAAADPRLAPLLE